MRPDTLPDMTITRGQSRGDAGGGGGGGGGKPQGGRRGSNRQGGGGGGGEGGGDWSRGAAMPRRQSTEVRGGQGGGRGGGGGGGGDGGGGGQWARGQSMPKPRPQDNRGRQRSGRGHGGQQDMYDGPVAPLVKSANHWRPKKSTSVFVIAEKQVKSILNKMTKEKFDRLSEQMMGIPILSSEMLTMMIDNVFDKAIDEPAFGDMYADLCVKLSHASKTSNFVHIIESDEEPPTEDGDVAPPADGGESSGHTVYRWSNDLGTSDAEVVGPFDSEDACYEAALSGEDIDPIERGDMTLELVSVSIKRSTFVKVMKKKGAEEGEAGSFYTVYFPVSEAKECGQQLSGIFLSNIECRSDATKKNSFKRSLLNKCEEEFNKQDIYVDWKKEKKEYLEKRSSMTETERAETEAELSFRRIRIKKQMLGNVKFIGQLYKKNLLKEKIMRFCIASLLKLEELENTSPKNPDYKDSCDYDMDEEDHEAICSIFTTIGSTIDTPVAVNFMKVCFTKITKLSSDKALPSRSRFMYKDLLDLRSNNWVPRRKEEKAKTLEEIRKDVEREERRQAQMSQSHGGGGGRGRGDYGGRGGGRGGDPRSRQPYSTGNRDFRGGVGGPKAAKTVVETDEDGFTTIGSKSNFTARSKSPKSIQSRNAPIPTKQTFAALAHDQDKSAELSKPGPAPLSDEKLERKFKSMRSDFLGDGGNVDEVLLTWGEVSGTPDAGRKIVTNSADRMMECKNDERNAIVRILSILKEKGKISKSDLQEGLADVIEFIDSTLMDSPKAYEYMGQLFCEMLRIKALDLQWICKELEKTKLDPNTKAPEKIVGYTLTDLKKAAGPDGVKSALANSESALAKLLGADKWRSISQTL